jgi:hypothetical protein
MFYTEVISLNEFLGYAVALTGFAFYNVAKSGVCVSVCVCMCVCGGGCVNVCACMHCTSIHSSIHPY